MKGLNSVYNVKERKGNLILRFSAFFYTVAFLLVIVFVLILLVFGTSIFHTVIEYFPFLSALTKIAFGLKNTFSITMLTGFFLLLYLHVPIRKTSIRSQIIGALFSAFGWTLYSFFFSLYISYFSGYDRLYGALGTILIFFVWLYMLMYILFLGAEINFFFSSEGKRYFSSFYY